MMLEACDVCGEATERGTCVECRTADKSRHRRHADPKTQRVLNIMGVQGILTDEQLQHAGTDWIDKAYRQQRRD